MNKNILSTIIDKVNDQRIKDEEDKIYAYVIQESAATIYNTLIEMIRVRFPIITKASSLDDLYLQIFYSNLNILLFDFLLNNRQNVHIMQTLDQKCEVCNITRFYLGTEPNVYEKWKMKAKNNQDYINKLICLYIKSIELKWDFTSYAETRNHVYITKMCL